MGMIQRRFLGFILAPAALAGTLVGGLASSAAEKTSDPQARPAAPADFVAYAETVPGTTVKFDMVPIQGGKFLMGSPAKEKGRRPDEGPQHEVEVRPFWMGAREVTWDEYGAFLKIGIQQALSGDEEEGPDALTYPTPPYSDETFGFGKGEGQKRQPTIALTLHAVMEYARWLSQKTGKLYRLPTEAEWEYACRAGTTTAYSFGDNPKTLGDHAWLATNAKRRPQPVAEKKPNPWGLFDMHGNTAEWVIDQYDPKFYEKAQPGVFPVNLPGDRRYSHVVRGGGWKDKPAGLRCAVRRFSEKWWSKQDPQSPQSIWWHTEVTDVGFRLVRPVDEYPVLKGLRSKMTKESAY